MLRILRPLRFISHNKNLRIIVNSLLGSFNGIFNVTIVILLIFIMFAILGVYLFQGSMSYCANTVGNPYWDEYDISKAECETTYKDVAKWALRDYNFEDVFKGLLTLMVFVTLEAWPTLAFWIIDGPPDN